MGLKDRLRNLFSKTTEMVQEVEKAEDESSEDNAQFMAMAKEISDELIDELINNENTPLDGVETILISEYDAGEVEADQLAEEETSMINYNHVNVVNHDSLDDIEEHLEGAEIIGDLPDEITF